jgi:hypothetical protein
LFKQLSDAVMENDTQAIRGGLQGPKPSLAPPQHVSQISQGYGGDSVRVKDIGFTILSEGINPIVEFVLFNRDAVIIH